MGIALVIILGVCFAFGIAKGVRNNRAGLNSRGQAKLSDVGVASAGGLQCPKCGSTSFKSKRSAGGKVAGGLLAPKTRVRCEACGTEFVRG